MKRAGLTHGGFYAHFPSRDDLVANAIDRMFADSRSLLDACLRESNLKLGIASFIDGYLAPGLRSCPEHGCPLPALSGEALRLPDEARSRFNKGVDYLHGRLAEAFNLLGEARPQDLASSIISEMSGAMALARATPDRAKGDQILRASRRLLKERLGLI
jgi:TetR/AcrR family transcriptional repressor of nem operon